MQSRKDRLQEDLFIASPLRDLVPEDHILKRVDAILDLSWLHDEVSECHCQDNGRPNVDPDPMPALSATHSGLGRGLGFLLSLTEFEETLLERSEFGVMTYQRRFVSTWRISRNAAKPEGVPER